MGLWRIGSLPTRRPAQRRRQWRSAAAFGFALFGILGGDATAQPAPSGVYAPGDAAVTGFSGALAPILIAPGVDPNHETFIDPNGPSLRVVDLRRMDGPLEAQLVGAPKPFTVSAASVGQVFGVALDDSPSPNIYVAATSAYGLPIVAPGPDGRPQHIRTGAKNATFMAGLWGPQGGPGSIWKIDGASGRVSLFADVALNGRANSGPALGGLAYDPDSKSLFVADRETGLIHRFGLDGHDLGIYDHGVAGRTAQGFPPAPWKSQPGIDVASPQFDSAQPATWKYAAPERRVFGLAVHQRRLYYAVADGLQVWSVGLNADGSFSADAVIEIAAPPSAGPTEISKITFDEQGRMFLAERPAATGAFDFEALSIPSIGRALRYTAIGATTNGRRIWQPLPDEYAVGFPHDFRNDNGGVAIGYSYRQNGDVNLASCGGFVWTTGEQLRNASDPKLAAQLGQTGALAVNGLQGDPTWRIRRDDEPPVVSYFIDYADQFPDPAARGRMGDIAIARSCAPAQPAGLTTPLLPGDWAGLRAPPGMPAPPPGAPPRMPPRTTRVCQDHVCGPTGTPVCPANQVWRAAANACESNCERPEILVGGRCCRVNDVVSGGVCSNSTCGAGQMSVGPSNFCCNSSQVYSDGNGGQACCAGAVVNGACQPPTLRPTPTPTPNCPPGATNPQCCSQGYVSTGGSCCLASQATSTGICCPSGKIPSADKSQCLPIGLPPIRPRCCAASLIPAGDGSCCPAANLTTSGVCCSRPVDPKDRRQCAAQTEIVRPCAPGEFRDVSGACAPIPSPACPPDEVRGSNGACQKCPAGAYVDQKTSTCACPADSRLNPSGTECVRPEPPGKVLPILPGPNPSVAPAPEPRPHPPGEKPGAPAPVVAPPSPPPVHGIVCPPDMVLGPFGQHCFPRLREPAPGGPAPGHRIVCPPGMVPGPLGLHCFPRSPSPALGRRIACPPGMVPGPLGRHCFPIGRLRR